MRRILLFVGSIVALGIAGLFLWAALRVRASSARFGGAYLSEWSPASATRYLDNREEWWQTWPAAKLEKGTVCISCHTVVPYVFARPALRRQLGETGLTSSESKILGSIETRVNEWEQMKPYYTDVAHAESSHSTEAILNAVILAAYGTSQKQLDPVIRRAFSNAWALQETAGENAGGWKWQDFHESPWESAESAYQGAAMMAVAVGMTPAQNRSNMAEGSHINLLRDYLLRNYSAQPVWNQLYVLWASDEMPGLLNDVQRKELITKITSLQDSDGGWSLPSLDRKGSLKSRVLDFLKHADRVDGSDGCATGLVVLAMEKAGVNLQDAVLERGLTWLKTHQSQEGSWWAASMNGFRDPSSGMGHFMSDAATGYAVMALEGAAVESNRANITHNDNAADLRTERILRQVAFLPKPVTALPQ